MGKFAKRLTALALAVAFVLVTAGGGFAVELPWKKFSESVQDTTGSDMGMCPSGAEIYRARLEKNGDAYVFWYSPDTDNILMLYYKGNKTGALPDEVGLGKVDMTKHDDYPEFKWISIEEAKARFSTPCDFLAPAKS